MGYRQGIIDILIMVHYNYTLTTTILGSVYKKMLSCTLVHQHCSTITIIFYIVHLLCCGSVYPCMRRSGYFCKWNHNATLHKSSEYYSCYIIVFQRCVLHLTKCEKYRCKETLTVIARSSHAWINTTTTQQVNNVKNYSNGTTMLMNKSTRKHFFVNRTQDGSS